MFIAAIGLIVAGLMSGQASAGQTNIAVTANFTDAAKEIATAFKKTTEDDAMNAKQSAISARAAAA